MMTSSKPPGHCTDASADVSRGTSGSAAASSDPPQQPRPQFVPSSTEIRDTLSEWKPKVLKGYLDECGVSHRNMIEKEDLVGALAARLAGDEKLRLRMLTFCEICCSWLRTEDMWPLTCKHLVCEVCLGRHLAVEAEKMLSNAQRHPLPCLFPECGTPISVATATSFCKQVRGVWHDLGQREKLLSHARYPVAECPKPGCVGVAYVEPGRRNAMCFLCEHQWQVSEADDSTAQPNFGSNVRVCPKCQAPIEKTWGCDHMDCTKCGRRFNWSGADYANTTHSSQPSGSATRPHHSFGSPDQPPDCSIC